MIRLARRLAWSLGVVWAVVSIAFAVNVLLPGDAARMVAGPQARPADVARIRTQLGLDQSPAVQYARFWKRLVHVGPRATEGAHATCAVLLPLGRSALHLDFGKSFQMRQPVVDVVAARMPRTLVLAVAGVLVQLLLGVSTGVIAALRRGSWIDRLLVGTSLLGISAPTFLIALLLQVTLARELRWLPLDGYGADFGEHARSLVLPALTLGLYGAAYYTRLVRDEMRTLLDADWVRTARAKGLPPWRVVTRHALRNALVPIVTAAGLDFGALMGGAIVTEQVFELPGLGWTAVHAIESQDLPLIMGIVIVASAGVVIANLLVDIFYAVLDPRVRIH